MSEIPCVGDREIITLQLGTLSNLVGVHFWGLQNAYFQSLSDYEASTTNPCIFSESILFSTTPSSKRPRLLAVDWYDYVRPDLETEWTAQIDNTNSCLWDGQVDKIVRSNPSPGRGEVHFPPSWASCLIPSTKRTWFEHGIICPVPEFPAAQPKRVSNIDIPITSFFQGCEILAPGKHFTDELEDNFRHQLELCSLIGGVQMFVDEGGAFAGMASRLLDYMDDEIPKHAVLSIPVCDSSLTNALDKREQLLIKASQLAFLVHLEPSMYHLMNGAWLPVDLLLSDCSTSPCFINGLVAGTLDAATTWIRLAESYGGVPLDEFVFISQQGHGQRMLSAHTGYTLSDSDPIVWKSYSPYINPGFVGDDSAGKSLWRQVSFRGLPVTKYGLPQFDTTCSVDDKTQDYKKGLPNVSYLLYSPVQKQGSSHLVPMYHSDPL